MLTAVRRLGARVEHFPPFRGGNLLTLGSLAPLRGLVRLEVLPLPPPPGAIPIGGGLFRQPAIRRRRLGGMSIRRHKKKTLF